MMFVTMFFAMLAPPTGVVEFCNAGHNSPYRLKGSELAPIEDAKGIVLGVRPDASHAAGRLTLAVGEAIFLFSDGVTEAANPASELFSEQRLESVLRRVGGRTSAEIINAVAAEVKSFAGAAQPSDDITMLTLRRLDGSALR
jgi:phosphoserine phosphatase RsbU/P